MKRGNFDRRLQVGLISTWTVQAQVKSCYHLLTKKGKCKGTTCAFIAGYNIVACRDKNYYRYDLRVLGAMYIEAATASSMTFRPRAAFMYEYTDVTISISKSEPIY